MPYNSVADTFHRKKFCSRFSSSDVRFYNEVSRFAFLIPFGGLRGNELLIGKHVMVFLFLVIELFSVGVTAETLRACCCFHFSRELGCGNTYLSKMIFVILE